MRKRPGKIARIDIDLAEYRNKVSKNNNISLMDVDREMMKTLNKMKGEKVMREIKF